jgi:hypothetical protein
MLINIGLPLTPFLVRIFIYWISPEGELNLTRIAELPEIIFFSICMCAVNLNINYGSKRGLFEWIMRLFFLLIIGLNCITLGMIYSRNIGDKIYIYSFGAAILPAIIAPIYKFLYDRNSDD